VRALVLIFVFVGLGMTVVASTTGTAALAWVSVAASIVAAVALAIDWRRRWTAIGDGDRIGPPGPGPAPTAEYPATAEQAIPWQQEPAHSPTEAVSDTADPTPQMIEPVQSAAAIAAAEQPASLAQLASEPGEESADAAAVAIVAKLDDEVHVVDEQPRYHLVDCHALVGQKSIAMPVKEAVESDFTPCEMCTPVRVLVSAGSAS
jgi:hypothetical protein